jgi:glycine/D-amino acid oxidase-like deaminating enzyme
MNVLIAGQGLAGTILHYTMFFHGIRATVVDDGWKNASSTGAAGLFNPIVFKRYSLAWRALEMYDYATNLYHQIEQHLGIPLVHMIPYAKIFSHPNDPAIWQERCLSAGFDRFMTTEQIDEVDGAPLKNHLGYGTVTGTGYVDLPLMLASYRQWLQNESMLIPELMDSTDLVPNQNGVTWRNEPYDLVILATGFRGAGDTWFADLPLRFNQGEVLKIHAPKLQFSRILNRSIFIVPLGNHYYRVGATYNWKTDCPDPTPEGRADLEKRLRDTIDVPFEVEDHWGGVRPVTPDRRPLCGRHPRHKSLAIFNGLGTRGVLNAPLLAHELVQNLIHNTPLHPEADIQRFYHRD